MEAENLNDTQTLSEIRAEQEAIVGEFAMFDDWMGRYEYLIDLGQGLPEFAEDWKTAGNKIHGCQSQVWFRTQLRDGRLHIDGISDAAIVCGLIAVLLRVYSDRLPQDILAADAKFLEQIGFHQHLSPTRSNGLHAMLEGIYERARAAA